MPGPRSRRSAKGYKRCPRCEYVKSVGNFSKRPSGSPQSWCRSCAAAAPGPPPDRPGKNTDPLAAWLERRRTIIATTHRQVEVWPCEVCCRSLVESDFSETQWGIRYRRQPICLECRSKAVVERRLETYDQEAADREERLRARGIDVDQQLVCIWCRVAKTLVHFHKAQWRRRGPVCRVCLRRHTGAAAFLAEEARIAERRRRE